MEAALPQEVLGLALAVDEKLVAAVTEPGKRLSTQLAEPVSFFVEAVALRVLGEAPVRGAAQGEVQAAVPIP